MTAKQQRTAWLAEYKKLAHRRAWLALSKATRATEDARIKELVELLRGRSQESGARSQELEKRI